MSIMKKFLPILLVLCMVLAILPAGAEPSEYYKDETMTITMENDTYQLSEINFKTMPAGADEPAVFIAYTPDHAIYAVSSTDVTTAEGKSSAKPNLALPQDLKFIVKAYFAAQNAILTVADTTKDGITPSEPTPTPTVTPTATPEASSFPAAYESAAVAMQAFMVVKQINAAVTDNNDTVYALLAYYQGREITLMLPDDATLHSAPDAESHLARASVSALQEGDVIYCTFSLSGALTKVDLIFRPQNNDIMTGETDFGADFEQLFTTEGTVAGRWPAIRYGSNKFSGNQYAFGLIKDKTSRNLLVLANKTGLESNDLELDLQKDTIVYVYDKTARDKLSIGTLADITRSELPELVKDEDGNIKEWSKDYVYNYALARTYDGIVTDIIVFLNYNA